MSAANLASMFSPMGLLNANASSVKPQTASTTGTSSTSGNSGLDGTTTGTTFLNLLVKELQNQDPSAPMDSTAMVGQMISLNQLDQLISINQVLSNATTSTSSSTSGSSGGSTAQAVSGTSGTGSAAQVAQRAALLKSTQNANVNAIEAATQSASDPNQTLNLSALNIPNGGR